MKRLVSETPPLVVALALSVLPCTLGCSSGSGTSGVAVDAGQSRAETATGGAVRNSSAANSSAGAGGAQMSLTVTAGSEQGGASAGGVTTVAAQGGSFSGAGGASAPFTGATGGASTQSGGAAGLGQGGSGGSTVAQGGSSGANSPGGSSTGNQGDAGATAPLDWTMQGTRSFANGLTWSTPSGWTSALASDGVVLTAPAETGGCAIAILQPRAAAVDQAGRLQQLLDLVTSEFSGHTLSDEYGNWPPTAGITRGTSGSGFEFVGYNLEVDKSTLKIQPYLAVFGTMEVPVVPIANVANGSCLLSSAGAVNALEIFYSITMDGYTGTLPVAPSVVGSWFAGSSGIGLDVELNSDGTYVRANVYDELGTKVTTSESGAYTVSANVISFFPAPADGTPISHYFRTYEESNSSVTSGWVAYYCELALSTDSPPAPYELCYWQ
jgi:hypothetical protein